MAYIPQGVVEFLGDYMPNKKYTHVRRTAKLATEVAQDLVNMKSEALLQGKGRHRRQIQKRPAHYCRRVQRLP